VRSTQCANDGGDLLDSIKLVKRDFSIPTRSVSARHCAMSQRNESKFDFEAEYNKNKKAGCYSIDPGRVPDQGR